MYKYCNSGNLLVCVFLTIFHSKITIRTNTATVATCSERNPRPFSTARSIHVQILQQWQLACLCISDHFPQPDQYMYKYCNSGNLLVCVFLTIFHSKITIRTNTATVATCSERNPRPFATARSIHVHILQQWQLARLCISDHFPQPDQYMYKYCNSGNLLVCVFLTIFHSKINTCANTATVATCSSVYF